MSMIGEYVRVTAAELDRVVQDPDWGLDFVEEVRDAEEESEGLADELAEAEEDGVESAFRASVTARPWEVADEDGEAEDDPVAFWDPDALLDGEALGEALELPLEDALGEALDAAPALASWARTGRKYSFAVVPTCLRASSEFVPLGMLTMMLLVPWV